MENSDSTLVSRLVEVFGQHPRQAAEFIAKWNWVSGDIDLWEIHLRKLQTDPKIRSPQAVCASLMRKQKHPEAPAPGEEKYTLVARILESHRGRLYRGKKGDYWKIIPQGLINIENGRLLLWAVMLNDDLRKIDREAFGTKPYDGEPIPLADWLRSKDCETFLRERKACGVTMPWVEKLRDRALEGEKLTARDLSL